MMLENGSQTSSRASNMLTLTLCVNSPLHCWQKFQRSKKWSGSSDDLRIFIGDSQSYCIDCILGFVIIFSGVLRWHLHFLMLNISVSVREVKIAHSKRVAKTHYHHRHHVLQDSHKFIEKEFMKPKEHVTKHLSRTFIHVLIVTNVFTSLHCQN